ncbi:hypothetical protein GOBAR_AA05039 [Gossypium barbadense]|uniref:O-fucosyltransferase family protein n=1 Tax=Gossypium barbadense TaxID=3634 RepID=A0A2P5YIW9_GOSBA|nr:hypothetical protein GOBAR_AA05039 [Gossypium barbadense]
MALPRRRKLHYHRLGSLVQVASAISGTLLLLFAFLSFFFPSPDESEHFHLRHRQTSFNAVVKDSVSDRNSVFKIPVRAPSLLSTGGKLDRDIWSSKNAKFFYGCSNASARFAKAEAITHPTRYLAIATSGGLNQQRTGVSVVATFQYRSFILTVSTYSCPVTSQISLTCLKRGSRTWTPYTMRVPRKCSERCYLNHVLPVLLKRHNAVQLNKFDYRLANRLDTDLQKLRCRVNYHALQFANPILEMGKMLVQRMRMRSKHYIALHLRFEPDMLAFSGCDYGGGEKEKNELGAIQKRWKTLHKNNPDKERRQGRCPLTPEEVGLMLRALGYGSDVHIYVASGEVYGGEETLRPLKALFPNFYSKDTIATNEELGQFLSFSSRMAALDFIVCDESDVFVTNNNGNMARILAGRRKYFGHKPTIRPNAKKLYRLFLSRNNMTWEEFSSRIRTLQKGFMGEPKEVRPGRGEFHENPSTCICEDSEAMGKLKADSRHKKHRKLDDSSRKDVMVSDDQNDYDDNDVPEWPDLDEDEDEEEEDESGSKEKHLSNVTGSDYGTVISDEPELEAMLSD